jgi:hypothetical protein
LLDVWGLLDVCDRTCAEGRWFGYGSTWLGGINMRNKLIYCLHYFLVVYGTTTGNGADQLLKLRSAVSGEVFTYHLRSGTELRNNISIGARVSSKAA